MRRSIPIVVLTALWGLSADADRAARADVIISVTETAIFNTYFGEEASYSGGSMYIRHRDFGAMNTYAAMRIDLASVDAYLAANPGSYVDGVTLSVALERTDPSPGPGKNYWFEYHPADWADNWDPRTITNRGSFPLGIAQVNFPDNQDRHWFYVDGADPVGQVYSLTNDALRNMVANDTNRVLTLWFASPDNSSGANGWFNRYFNDVRLSVRFAGGSTAVPEPASVLQAAIGLTILAGAGRRLLKSRAA